MYFIGRQKYNVVHNIPFFMVQFRQLQTCLHFKINIRNKFCFAETRVVPEC